MSSDMAGAERLAAELNKRTRWIRWCRDIGCRRFGRPSPWSAKTRIMPS